MKKSNAGLSSGGTLLTKVGPVHVVVDERLAGERLERELGWKLH